MPHLTTNSRDYLSEMQMGSKNPLCNKSKQDGKMDIFITEILASMEEFLKI